MKKIIDKVYIISRPVCQGRDGNYQNKDCYHVGIRCNTEYIKLFSSYNKKWIETIAKKIAKQLNIEKINKTGKTYYGYDTAYH